MRFLQTRFFGQKEQVVEPAGTGRTSRAFNGSRSLLSASTARFARYQRHLLQSHVLCARARVVQATRDVLQK
jgi:hypothetical protein